MTDVEFNDRRESCSLCGSSGNEYQGSSSRGCPDCGRNLSPLVTVKDGTVYHDDYPVGAHRFKHDPTQASFVRPRDSGYQAGHYSNGGSGSELVSGSGRTPRAAAEDAARQDAAKMGQTFVKRPAAVEKAIKRRRIEDGY